jgi:4-carboxymuconolactone decarboxylase
MLNLYHLLLQSPPVADGWRALLTAVRQQCNLAGRYRELAILQVAVLNRAKYEFDAHVPFAINIKEGFTREQLEVMREGNAPQGLTAADQAVLDYTTAMTRDVEVPDALFASVKKHFTDREMVELSVTVAAYNLVSRFLVAMKVDHEAH